MRDYLDNCCYNRPFDDQGQLKVRVETMAKVGVQLLMWTGKIEYVWSDVLDYEVSRNPHRDRASLIMPWRKKAVTHVGLDRRLIIRGKEISMHGLKMMDAFHVACAEQSGCNWFLTTDAGILKRLSMLGTMKISSPVQFVMEECGYGNDDR